MKNVDNVTKTSSWIRSYVKKQKDALDSLQVAGIAAAVLKLREAADKGFQIFVIGNGGSGANASHFATDLSKTASNGRASNFRCLSLTDNVPFITAIGNDREFRRVFSDQLKTYARPNDILIGLSVSGASGNIIEAFQWASQHDLYSIAITKSNGGMITDLADQTITIDDKHYGRVEDVGMTICHMLVYSFVECDFLA